MVNQDFAACVLNNVLVLAIPTYQKNQWNTKLIHISKEALQLFCYKKFQFNYVLDLICYYSFGEHLEMGLRRKNHDACRRCLQTSAGF